MNVGVVGVGVMGKNHVRVFSEIKDVESIYIYDVDKEKMKNIKKYFKNHVHTCSSLAEIIKNVDAATICVPTTKHFKVAKKFIENDVHCLIEKPMTLSVDEGEEILKLLKNKEIIVGVGHIERFNPIVCEILKIVKNPTYIEIKRHNPASSRVTDSSVIEDLMIHDIDLIFNVFFKKRSKKYDMQCIGSRDICMTLLTLNNTFVALSASRLASKKIRKIYIENKEYTLEADFMTQEVYIYRKPVKHRMENERYSQENVIEKVLVNKVEPLKVELKTFVDCIKNNKKFPVTPEQAVNNLKVCEEIEKKLKIKKRVGVV